MLGRKVRFERFGSDVEGYVFASDSSEYSIAYLDGSGESFKSLVFHFVENWEKEIDDGRVKIIDLHFPEHLKFRRLWVGKHFVKPVIKNIE